MDLRRLRQRAVDFYESARLARWRGISAAFSSPIKVAEKDHQALLLLTDENNEVFAAGLNRGNFPYFDKLVFYQVDLVGRSMKPDPDRSYSTGGATRLRWGSALELIGTRLALHRTTRNYGASCRISTFDAGRSAVGDAPVTKAARRARKSAKKPSVRKQQSPSRARRTRSRSSG